jgi:hypothetical protein
MSPRPLLASTSAPSLTHRAIRRVTPLLALVVASAPTLAGAQTCDVAVAALGAVGATTANTLLVDRTALGIPTFAFAGFFSPGRTDTALARNVEPRLRGVNGSRAALPPCLVDSLRWRTIDDSTLVGFFRPTGERWTGFRDRFPSATQFAVLSQPLLAGDTAVIYVGLASGERSGHGVIMVFVRDATGRWAKRAEITLWIA